MTGLPDNNGNDFIRGLETRACVNGMTKSDVERLKNALVKKILDDETVIDVTEDGSIIADSNGMFISVNGKLLGLSVDGEDVIPVTEPYLPEDENENPLAPPNDTIMTSANIAVDPRIVRTTGNQEISGNKKFINGIIAPPHNFFLALGWTKLFEFVEPCRVLFKLCAGSSIIECYVSTTTALNVRILTSNNRPYTDCIKRAVDNDGKISIWFNALYGSWARGYIEEIGKSNGNSVGLSAINILNQRIADGPTTESGYTDIVTATTFELII